MFLSQEIDKKLCINYTKLYTYVRFCMIFVLLNRSYSTNTQPIWKRQYPGGAWETQVCSYYYLNLIIFILIDIIDIIVPDHGTRTPTNGSAVLLSRVSVCITWPVYCIAIGGSSGHVIRTYVLHIYVLV